MIHDISLSPTSIILTQALSCTEYTVGPQQVHSRSTIARLVIALASTRTCSHSWQKHVLTFQLALFPVRTISLGLYRVSYIQICIQIQAVGFPLAYLLRSASAPYTSELTPPKYAQAGYQMSTRWACKNARKEEWGGRGTGCKVRSCKVDTAHNCEKSPLQKYNMLRLQSHMTFCKHT